MISRGPGAASGGSERRSFDRHLFVVHQQELARRARHLGSPGAARAALRALYGVDFVDATGAAALLRVLRDPEAHSDALMMAMRGLTELEPEELPTTRDPRSCPFLTIVPFED